MSNNSLITESFEDTEFEGADPKVELEAQEQKLLEATRLFRAFRALRMDDNFKIFRELVIGDEQRVLGNKLKSERDPIEMARCQGALTLLDRINSVESLERSQDDMIVHIKGRIATIKQFLGINGTDNES